MAELPTSVGFEVRHTAPSEDTAINETLAFIETCDLYILVLGADYAAPMGLEWQRAQDAAKPTLAFRKRELHSPSAEHLLREPGIEWTLFGTPEQLKTQATQALAQMLIDRGESFGLLVDDIDALLTVLGTSDRTASGQPDRRQGAGHSGVILGREGQR